MNIVLLLAAAARAQLALEAAASQLADGSFAYYTQNVLAGGAPTAPFALSFDHAAASTIAWGTKINETHVANTLTTPREMWQGAFLLTPQAGVQTLAFAQLASAGTDIAWCDGVVYVKSQRWPATCTSKAAIHARCTAQEGCRYAASVDNDASRLLLAKADPHAAPPEMECTLQLTLENGVRVCSDAAGVFNPVEAGASIVQAQHFQSLYFNRRAENGPAGAVFAIAIILCLVVWVRNVPVFERGVRRHRSATISWGVSDLSITAASASIFALADGGTAYVPPELELIAPSIHPDVWLATYIVVTLGGSAIASAAALARSTQSGTSPLSAVVRIAIEIQLFSALHFHLPTTMGLALRRTLGFFCGVAALVVIGRDCERAVCNIGRRAAIVFVTWLLVAVVHIVANLILPTIAQSAGIADEAAPEVAVALAAMAVAFAVVRLS